MNKPENQSETSARNSHAEFLMYFSKERLRIYAFIYSLVQQTADAEDLFQQTSVTLWEKFQEFDADRDFYSWACGVAFYHVQNFRRLAVNRKFIFSDALIRELADVQMRSSRESSYKLELLDECIAHLKDRDRAIVAKVYGDESAVAKVAEAMSRSIQTIYNRLNLIRGSLLECVERKMAARSDKAPGTE